MPKNSIYKWERFTVDFNLQVAPFTFLGLRLGLFVPDISVFALFGTWNDPLIIAISFLQHACRCTLYIIFNSYSQIKFHEVWSLTAISITNEFIFGDSASSKKIDWEVDFPIWCPLLKSRHFGVLFGKNHNTYNIYTELINYDTWSV